DALPISQDAHLEALVVGDAVDLLPEPSRHLHARGRAGARDEIEARVGLFPQLETVAVEIPGHHALRVEAEGHGREPLHARLLAGPVVGRAHETLGHALRCGFEDAESRHQLAGREHMDLVLTAARLILYI